MPKKKPSKKGAKIIDGVATNEMTREQLMGHVKRMQMELNREREERNFFMLEREKLYSLWHITLEQLAAAKSDMRLADVRMDDTEKERETEMHVYKQKLRFLMTEQSRRVAEVRLQSLQQMKSLQDSTSSVLQTTRETIDGKNRQISKSQTSIYAIMRQLQLENAENVSKLKADFCAELRRIDSTFERMLHEREKTQELHEAVEIQRTHQEKSEHISQLMDLHQRQIKDMKDYFNEITANNFAVISGLQEELARLQVKEQELGFEVTKGRKQIKGLEESILQGKEEVERVLQEDKRCALEIRRQLEQRNKRLKQFDKYSRVLEIQNETLVQRAELAQRERDVLKKSFAKSIVDMQKKSNMHRLILEMKLNTVSRKPPSKKENLQFRSSGSISSAGDSSPGAAGSEIGEDALNKESGVDDGQDDDIGGGGDFITEDSSQGPYEQD